MCDQQKTAKEIIRQHIIKKEPFKYRRLQQEIVDNGGILQIEAGYTFGQYINDLEERGIIEFHAKEDVYTINGFGGNKE